MELQNFDYNTGSLHQVIRSIGYLSLYCYNNIDAIILVSQVVLKFKENFWQKVVQEADFFGHVPQSGEGRGHCGLFYDLGRKVAMILSCSILLFLNKVKILN